MALVIQANNIPDDMNSSNFELLPTSVWKYCPPEGKLPVWNLCHGNIWSVCSNSQAVTENPGFFCLFWQWVAEGLFEALALTGYLGATSGMPKIATTSPV